MTTTAAAASTAATTSTAGTQKNKLNANFDTFLKMLTTQLQFQDPLEPMDTAQFTNQLVMYSQVEQQISTNDKLDDLISSDKKGGVQSALGYLGYYVEANTSQVPLQNKAAYFNINLADKAAKVSIGIYDSDNKLVKSIMADGAKGVNTFTWDGKDTNGVQKADGSYKVVATATRTDGTTVTNTISSFGLVTSIDVTSSGDTVLKADDLSIAPDKVISVRGVGVSSSAAAG